MRLDNGVCLFSDIFGYGNLFIVLMRNPKSGPLPLTPTNIIKIGPWRRILLHILLQPFRKLLLIPKAKPHPLRTIRLKTRIDIITRLPLILTTRTKPIRFRYTINMNGLLEG